MNNCVQDVYKRQVQARREAGEILDQTAAQAAKPLPGIEELEGAVSFEPVSYTHLDVYKRQQLVSSLSRVKPEGHLLIR